jgi:hypothetical protein
VFDKVQPSVAPPCLVDLNFGPDQPDGGVDKASGGEHKDGGKPEEKKVEVRHLPQSMMKKIAVAAVKAVLPPRYACIPFPPLCFPRLSCTTRSFPHVLPDHVVTDDGTYRHWQLNYVVEK